MPPPRPDLDALPDWPAGTVAVLATSGEAPHAIPVSTAIRAGERRIVLALAARRESLARLRTDQRCALALLAAGNVAITAHGRAEILEGGAEGPDRDAGAGAERPDRDAGAGAEGPDRDAGAGAGADRDAAAGDEGHGHDRLAGVVAVALHVDRIQDHGRELFEIDDGVRWRWTDRDAQARDDEVRQALARLARG